jgi:23S rRNA (uracil1939-C5)-methyltransferase
MAFAKDDVVRLTIEDIGTDGEGIGKVDGYTLFVKDAVIGDVVTAKIIKAKKNFGYGRLLEIITPSKDRVTPVCPVARQCGGCQIQQMSYGAQLEYKRRLVEGNLRRIGGLENVEVQPVIGMDEPYHYRNKAQYPVGLDRDGNVIMGFYAGRTHHIIDNMDCAIGAVENAAILAAVKDYIVESGVGVYDETTGKGAVRHILIRKGFHTGEIMVCVVANAKKLPKEEMLVEKLVKLEFEGNAGSDGREPTEVQKCSGVKSHISSIILNINKENTNVILGDKCRTLWGKDYIEDSINGVKFQISPLSFYQVNPVQTEKLYAKAVEFAGLTGNENVWDLYCGIGTISLIMAGSAKHVTGVEIVPQAIENAKNNAKANGIENAEFHVGKAEEVAPLLAKQGNIPDVIVVDPPRKGCDEALLETIVKMNPPRVVYVSCDSATLARDLKWLCANGYKLDEVQPVDQFGHSVHVEVVSLLSRA